MTARTTSAAAAPAPARTRGGEANICQEPSQTVKVLCINNNNCISCCINENYTGGYCGGVIGRKCMCTKDCGDTPPPQPSLPSPKGGRRRSPPRAATTMM
ncbi:hypothetical protein E2562_031622 [Oryza meyeriana var. granulata]|uniref:Knottins-like domain-containing protein n=1 Tax=Oryza meyeriana var. granulata TaxID=110450 RepID=A0A6G1D9M7_9ORYZ|nr:hypothetical protein E2562_031622 [Oryza meyeriana var. granulata]